MNRRSFLKFLAVLPLLPALPVEQHPLLSEAHPDIEPTIQERMNELWLKLQSYEPPLPECRSYIVMPQWVWELYTSEET